VTSKWQLKKLHPHKCMFITVGDVTGDSMNAKNWTAKPLQTPGAETRTKMDNVYVADLDGDGDKDIVTTEENGGWGVVWFGNPAK
jgi:hypothetical protein